MQVKFNSIFSLLLLLSSVSGCAAVVVGAVAATGATSAVVATDPRSSGTVVDDNTIQTKLKSKYSDYPNSNIYVNSYNGNILLTGQVPDDKTKESAEFNAKVTPGVRQIYDYLETRLPQSFGSATTDSYTTTQVKTKILKLDGVDSNSIKVITTNDVVYLAGVVTPEQGKKAAGAAASVGGVKKVVTLFQYITAK